MSQIQINTTQNVPLQFELANEGLRIVAYLIDNLIKGAYIFLINLLVLNALGLGSVFSGVDNWSATAIAVLFYFPAIFYTLSQEVLLEGQTIGKRLIKIKVVKIDGYQATFIDYLIRWVFRLVDLFLFGGLVALITVVSNSKKQRFGGMATGTAVIDLRSSTTIDHTILEELKEDYKPTYASVIRLSDNDARIIKESYKAAIKEKNQDTLQRLKTKVEEVIGEPSKHINIATFIDVVLKDYNFYTGKM